MADTSNKFSLNGLNRQKQLSGLHAAQPQNTDLYFDYTQSNVSPQYVSILELEVDSIGYNYSKNTTLTFPTPEHPLGARAIGKVLFRPCKNTFSVVSGGSGYNVGDIFSIIHNNTEIGSFVVSSTGNSGAITNYNIYALSIPLDSTSLLPTIDFSFNDSAVVQSNDKFDITQAVIEYPGCGYQTYNRSTGQTINHNPSISNTGSSSPQPSGLQIKSSIKPFIHKQEIEDDRTIFTTIDKFERPQTLKQNKQYYFIVNNFSLGDPS